MLGFPSALRSGSMAASRALSTSAMALNAAPVKVPVALIAKLRKEHPVPMSQAREALEKTNLDVAAAIAYLSSATSDAALKKAAKVADRATSEGTVAISVLGGRRVAMVQLACETDFVARNDVFLKAARGIAETAAFLDVPTEVEMVAVPEIQAFPNDALLSAPLISVPADGTTSAPSDEAQTVKQMLLASLSQTGENLKLVRAASFAAPFPSTPTTRLVPGAYTHGGTDTTGKVGGIVVLSVTGAADKPIAALIAAPEGAQLDTELQTLARSLARQVVGFPTKALSPGEGVEDEEALLTQTAMMLGSEQKVAEVVKAWGAERGVNVEVVDMRRWAVADAIEA